jgi:subtilase family serine protease
MKQLRRVLLPLLSVALLVSSLPSFSQTPFSQSPEPRIKGAITGASRAVLSNSRTPRVRDAEDLGAVSSNTPIPGITLVFKRSNTQEADLQGLLAAQQNTASPLYHQWLTPETFATRFGVAEEDIAATQSWLTSRGFHIDSVSRSRDRITFSGTAAQVQAAFDTELHHYRTEGELHFAPAADLTLPTELAPVTAAVLHLSDFRPKPNVKILPHPDYTTPVTQTHYLTPLDIETMYDLNPLNSNPLAATYFDGTGTGLAIVGQSYVNTAQSSGVFTFLTAFSVIKSANMVLVPGTGVQAISPGDVDESEIDLEYSSAIARNANVFLVYVGANQNYDVFDALAFAITENVAPVVSISYSVCEPVMSASDLNQNNALFEEAAAQGQTLVAAAGDSGSSACAQFPTTEVTPAQQQALAVGFPASSPYVTAVGGTQMAPGTFAAGSSPYWASASTADLAGSLLSYVPEVVWNEDSANNGIASGGGGSSTVFPRPAWQAGVPGILSGTYRLLPDLSLQSSIASPGFLICLDDQIINGSMTTGCTNGFQNGTSQYTTAGGTSFAAPIFAGFVALLNQTQQATGQGNVNPGLYRLASNPTTYAVAFHDITSGSNACLPAAATCSAASESSYAATTGYDLATGLGSVDFNALATAWPSSSNTNLEPTNVTIAPSDPTPKPGETVILSIYLSASLPNQTYPQNGPTGTLSISLDGVLLKSSLAVPPPFGSADFNITAPTTAGSHLVAVTYSGDATYSSSTANYSLLVGNVTATGSFSVTAGNLTVANGSTGSTQIAATPSGGYTGRVVWSLAATTTSTSATSTVCYSIGQPTTSNLNAAALTIGVGSACNSVTPADRSNLRPVNSRAASKQETPSPWRKTPQIAFYAGLILCGSLAGWRRKALLPLLLPAALLTFASIALIGCGGSSNSGSGSSTPPPSTKSNYTLTLTGTDSVNTSISASTTFTLTVN